MATPLDPKELTPEQVAAALKELSELKEQKQKGLQRGERLRVRNKILQEKALEAGFTATDDEIDAFLADKNKREALKAEGKAESEK